MEEEKRKAAQRVCNNLKIFIFSFEFRFKAKLLEKMDEEFGVNNLMHEESERRKQKVLRN